MCSDGWNYNKSEIDGECSSCGIETCEGHSKEGCYWSGVLCEDCGYAPCDESC